MAATSFSGFADTKASFFRALAKHQDRAWFAAHKAEYDDGWATPMAALLAEAREALDGEYPDFELGAPKVFRIHRDVRFSADKSPYKTHASGVLSLGHDTVKMDVATALYLQVGTETFAGAGTYGMEAPALAKYRAVVEGEAGVELEDLLRPLERKGFTLDSMGMLKRAPRGVDPDHPRVELLKRKGLAVMFPPLDPAELTTRKVLSTLVKHAKLVAPVVRWVARTTQE